MPKGMEVRHIAVASAGGTRQNHTGVIEGESPSSDILDAISRCAAAMDDEAQLRDELHVLRLSSDPLAHFATSLIDLERARRGDPEARAAVPIDLGRLTNLVGTQQSITERVHTYRAAGITTLLAKLEGEYPDQLATLERLLDAVNAG